MDTREAILAALEGAEEPLSGSGLARRLGVSRAAVWKAVQALRDEGYEIEAAPNRGYRLDPASDVLSAGGMRRALGDLAQAIEVEVLPSCVSTNLTVKQHAAALPAWHTVIAAAQTGGRGRMGRSFYSPEGTGLYMSVLLRPDMAAEDAALITTAAAVAVCRAAEELGSDRAEIKWVNDVLIRGRKVCGILTEAGLDMESGRLEYAVLGIGVNVTEPAGGFPPDIADVAGAVFPARKRDRKNALAAAILRQLYDIYGRLPDRGYVEEYRARCCLAGAAVNVLRGDESRRAMVLGVDDRCRLLVRYDDGSEEALFSGEVSVRKEMGT